MNLKVEPFGSYWCVVNYAEDGTRQFLNNDGQFDETQDDVRIYRYERAGRMEIRERDRARYLRWVEDCYR